MRTKVKVSFLLMLSTVTFRTKGYCKFNRHSVLKPPKPKTATLCPLPIFSIFKRRVGGNSGAKQWRNPANGSLSEIESTKF